MSPLGRLALILVVAALGAAPARAAAPPVALTSWGQSDADGQGGPAGVVDPAGPVALPAGVTPAMVAGSSGISPFALALMSDGSVYGWGSNSCGQLGGTPADSVPVPTRIVGLPSDVVAIDAGEEFSLAATASGDVWAWGRNDLGQLGDTSSTAVCTTGAVARPAPTRVPLPAGVLVVRGPQSISGGSGHALAVTAASTAGPGTTVHGWGYNGSGQLGNTGGYASTTPQPPAPMDLPGGTTPSQVAAGNQFSLVLTAAGGALSSGYGFGGQLGNGTSPAVGTPVLQTVLLPAGRTATQVAAGDQTGFAVMDDGGVQSWGIGASGERGDGTTTTTTNVPGPVAVPAGERVLAVAAGDAAMLAVTGSGGLYGWGSQLALNQPGTPAGFTAAPVVVPLPSTTIPALPAISSSAGYALTATTPAPVTGQSAAASVAAGTVRVKAPGAASFQRLAGTTLIAIGSTVDTRRGTVKLTTTRGTDGGLQTARFHDGVFVLGQKAKRSAVTALKLATQLTGCGSASASRRAHGNKKRVNGVWGKGKGRYTVTGHDGATAVKGTEWLTQDRCDGTFVRVRSGTVDVRDFQRRRTVTVHAGETYLARRGA